MANGHYTYIRNYALIAHAQGFGAANIKQPSNQTNGSLRFNRRSRLQSDSFMSYAEKPIPAPLSFFISSTVGYNGPPPTSSVAPFAVFSAPRVVVASVIPGPSSAQLATSTPASSQSASVLGTAATSGKRQIMLY